MLAFAFLNPSLLWLGALAAVPILIYLFHRQRYKTMKWAAMEFVVKAMRSSQRRLRIENLLLLLVRVLAVALLVAAVARPLVESAIPLVDVGDKRQNLAIVIDASYSMGYAQGGKSSFERAQKAAHDLAESALKRGDKLAVLVMAETPRFLSPDPVFIDDPSKSRALRDINEVEITAQPADASRTLGALAQYLPRFERPGGSEGGQVAPVTASKQVYVFTDMQRSSFANERGLRDPTVRRTAEELARQKADVVFVDCGSEDATNSAITRIDAAEEVAGVDIPLKVTAAVKNFGPSPAHDLVLEVYVDDTLQASPAVSLEPGEEREVERWVVFRDKGAHKVHALLKTDGLAVDNGRTLAIEAKEGVDVALVDGERKEGFGESETDFLAAALAPGEEGRTARDYLLRPAVYSEAQLSEIDLEKGPVLVLANVVAPTVEQAEKLDAFVKGGGGLLVFLGQQTDAQAWNERLWKGGKGPLPARLDRVVESQDETRYHVLDADTFDHPALRPFAGKETRTLLGMARFKAYWKLDWPDATIDDPSLSCVAWLAPRRATAGGEAAETAPAGEGEAGKPRERGERDPGLVEKRYGRGRCMVFTSTADGAWNNFFAQYAYLMLWQKVATHLADAGSARRNLLVGEPFELVVPSSEFTTDILLTTPGGDQIEKTLDKIPEEPDRFRLVHNETWKPGGYEVRFHAAKGASPPPAGTAAAPGERVEVFAVNVDPEEGDLARIEKEEIRSLIPELHFAVQKGGGAEKALKPSERGPEANELWRWALWAAIGMLVLESLLACAFGRRNA